MGRALERTNSLDVRRISINSSPSSSESNFRELDDVFLQTQTRIWLGEVLHTRFDDETTIADLLADGKLLFQVSKVVWKRLLTKCAKLRYSKAYFSEPVASGKSGGRYMPYSNVDSFLKICQILGLTGIDLFSPSDVVEKRDTRRVCMCIRSLSKKARYKDLNVPDFDVVTYTLAMPTDMVECIRRSLEQPQRRFSSSDSGDPYLDSKQKYTRNNWGADHTGQYDSYSEESDDAESNYRVFGFPSPTSTTSHNDASLLILDIDNSPEVSSVVVENFISRPSLFGSRRSYIGCQLGPSDSSGQGTDNGNSILFNGVEKDIVLNLHAETSFQGSNSTHRTSRYGLRRSFSQEIEDAEVSSTASLNSISGKVETLDYEDQFEAENEFTCLNIQVSQLQNLDTDDKDRSSIHGYESREMVEYDITVDSSTRDSDTPQFDMKFEDIGSSTKPLATSEWQSDSQRVQNDIVPASCGMDIPHVDSYFAKSNTVGLLFNCTDRLNSEDFLRNKYWSEHNENLPGQSDWLCSIQTLRNENHKCSMDIISNGSNHHGTSSKVEIVVSENKPVPPICGNVQTTECSDVGHPDTQTLDMVSMDDSVVPSSVGTPVCFYVPRPEHEPCETPACSQNVNEEDQRDQHLLNENDVQLVHQSCTDHEEEATSCVENMVKDKENQEKVDRDVRASERRSCKKVLLKSVAGGMTLVGVFFLLFNLRRSGREKTDEMSNPLIQIRKTSSGEVSSQKRQQRGRVEGVYPGEKLRF